MLHSRQLHTRKDDLNLYVHRGLPARVIANYLLTLGMCTLFSIYDAVMWVQPRQIPPPSFSVRGDLAVEYVVVTVAIGVRALWCHLYAAP